MFGTINVAILGTGSIASKMAETLKGVRKARAYAVGSRDLDRAVSFAQKYGFRRAYGTYEDLLADKKVDLVYIATPHSEHYENAKLAISYGRSVMVEKPFCVNAKQAEELVSLAEEKGVFLTEAMWTRYTPFVAKVREVLASGIIGEPVSITADVGANIAAVPRMTDPELAGGTLLDTGVYALNFASMMFGDDILKINATCTYTDRHLDEQDAVALVYKNGRVANLTASMIGWSPCQGVITGTKGYMVVEDIRNFRSLQVYDENGKRAASYRRPRQKTGYEYEVRAAIRAMSEGKLECYEMPHAQTISLMHMLDFVREQMGIVYPFEAREKILEEKRKKEEDRAAAAAIEEKAKEALAAKEEEEERGQIASDIQAQEAIEGHVQVGDDTDYTYGTAEAEVDTLGEDYSLPSEDTLVHAMNEAVREDERIRKAEEEKNAGAAAPAAPEEDMPMAAAEPETSDAGDVTEYIDLSHVARAVTGEAAPADTEDKEEEAVPEETVPDEAVPDEAAPKEPAPAEPAAEEQEPEAEETAEPEESETEEARPAEPEEVAPAQEEASGQEPEAEQEEEAPEAPELPAEEAPDTGDEETPVPADSPEEAAAEDTKSDADTDTEELPEAEKQS